MGACADGCLIFRSDFPHVICVQEIPSDLSEPGAVATGSTPDPGYDASEPVATARGSDKQKQ